MAAKEINHSIIYLINSYRFGFFVIVTAGSVDNTKTNAKYFVP